MKRMLIAVSLLRVLGGCTDPCAFEARCSGDVLETCSISSDQIFGDGITRTPCEAANPRCVEPVRNQARCVAQPIETCTSTVAPNCDGKLLRTCDDGYMVADSCAFEGPECVVLPTGQARCASVPLRACMDATFDGGCEGDTATRCTSGYVVTTACAALQLACSDFGPHGLCVR